MKILTGHPLAIKNHCQDFQATDKRTIRHSNTDLHDTRIEQRVQGIICQPWKRNSNWTGEKRGKEVTFDAFSVAPLRQADCLGD
uniref:Transposase n=1 Tax=Echinococcus granulosus TaxID=6210 RepID=A0A068X5K8_ECHGR|nr:hypothetical protein EgrG_002002200 [Echinococcus granulosus]